MTATMRPASTITEWPVSAPAGSIGATHAASSRRSQVCMVEAYPKKKPRENGSFFGTRKAPLRVGQKKSPAFSRGFFRGARTLLLDRLALDLDLDAAVRRETRDQFLHRRHRAGDARNRLR